LQSILAYKGKGLNPNYNIQAYAAYAFLFSIGDLQCKDYLAPYLVLT
jgi:hypothetical protein